MRKMLSRLALVLVMLLLSVLTAHADTLTMPDPLELGFQMSFSENCDDKYRCERNYKVENAEDAQLVVLAYLEKLMQYKELVYVECTTSPDGWIHHGFQPAEGYSYGTYYVHDGDWQTKPYCAAVVYKPGNRNVYIQFSPDFTLWDENNSTQGKGTSCNQIELGAVYSFQSAEVEEAVRSKLRKPEGDITYGELLKITFLDMSKKGITNITDLAYMTNLTDLYLDQNSITDITALSGLTNLTNLYLSQNSITDITALSGLTNLYSLELGDNQITEITALSGLTNLTYLGLSRNSITEITALSGLTNLAELLLDDNEITDITTLAGLTKLGLLTLDNNKIRDFSPINIDDYDTYFSADGNPGNPVPPSPTAKPTAKPTVEPEDCPKCGGTGRCSKCGGDMWVWVYEWEYINGFPESILKNKMCDAIYCVGGRCGYCGGDGKR